MNELIYDFCVVLLLNILSISSNKTSCLHVAYEAHSTYDSHKCTQCPFPPCSDWHTTSWTTSDIINWVCSCDVMKSVTPIKKPICQGMHWGDKNVMRKQIYIRINVPLKSLWIKVDFLVKGQFSKSYYFLNCLLTTSQFFWKTDVLFYFSCAHKKSQVHWLLPILISIKNLTIKAVVVIICGIWTKDMTCVIFLFVGTLR